LKFFIYHVPKQAFRKSVILPVKKKVYDLLNILKTVTLPRSLNYLRLLFSYAISGLMKRNLHRGLPFSLSLEPTTHCNLRCPHCPTGNKALQRPEGFMSLDNFKSFIEETAPHLMYLILYFQGEPFLHKNLVEMIRFAKQKRLYVYTSTNGHHINMELARELVAVGLDKIVISLDGISQEAYTSYRRNGKLSTVKESIKNLIRAKRESKSRHPFIEIQFLALKTNIHEMESVKTYCKGIGVDKLAFKTAQIYDFETDTEFIPSDTKYARYEKRNGKMEVKKKASNRCFRMWSSAVVTWDGLLVPCCFDKDASHAMGNVFSTKLKSLWRSHAYNAFRQQILKDRNQIDICQNCTE